MKREEHYVGHSVKVRPSISAACEEERRECARVLLDVADREHNRCKVGEKYFVIPGISGR